MFVRSFACFDFSSLRNLTSDISKLKDTNEVAAE